MKQKYKDMLKGAAIAQAKSSLKSSDSTSNSKTNLKYGIGSKLGLPDTFWGVLMGIWLLIVSLWVMVVGLILLSQLATSARMSIIAIVLGGLSWYIYYKIFANFTSLFFWVTFLPFFIYFLIWFFAPSVNVTSYMPNIFWFL